MFEPVFKAFGWLLAFFYAYVPPHNLGLSIILLTVTVMLCLFPLNAKQARSMIEMQRVQPEIKRLQQQYKDDRQKLNEEIMKFYQEHQINPLSGCLPILVQMPVLIILYHVIRSVESNVPTGSGRMGRLYADITSEPPLGLHFFGIDLTKTAAEARNLVSFVQWIPYLVLILLIIGTGWYQTHQTMARQKRTGGSQPVNAQMQTVMKAMPVVFGLLSFNFPSGLVLYWTTRNVWIIGQQHLVINKLYEKAHAENGGVVEAESKERTSTASAKAVTPSGRTGGKGGGSGGKGGGAAGSGGTNGQKAPARQNNTSQARRKKKKR